MSRKNYLLVAFNLIIAISFASVLCAQNINVNASVNKTKVNVDDEIFLEVSVSGDVQNLPDPVIPSLADFSIRSSGRSQSISIVNGVMSSVVKYSYYLIPQKEGKYSIGPISVKYGGEQYKSQVIQIEVIKDQIPAKSQGGNISSSEGLPEDTSDEVFIITSLNNRNPYIGEEIILSFKFLRRVKIYGDSNYQAPDIVGFIKEDLPPQLNYQTVIENNRYLVAEIRTALFPISAGKLTIGSAGLTATVERKTSRNRSQDDFFMQFFQPGEKKRFASKPITVDVKPLPVKDRPDNFKGAIGSFDMNTKIDKTAAVVNEPITLTVTIAGQGNIKSINEPDWPDTRDFKYYDTINNVNQKVENYHIAGSKVFQKVFIPQRSGKIAIPPVKFSYFDAEKKMYKTLFSKEILLDIKKSDSQTPYSNSFTPSEIRLFGKDIRFIKSDATFVSKGLLISNIFVQGLFVLPPAVFGFLLWYRRKVEHISRNISFYRATRASKKAKKELKNAQKKFASNKNINEYLNSLSFIFSNFLADKLGKPFAGLTTKEIMEDLTQRGMEEALISSTIQIVEEIDFLRFAPAETKELKNLDEQVFRVINLLDQGLKKR
ncbi:MAG: BatD family protein [bacterium]